MFHPISPLRCRDVVAAGLTASALLAGSVVAATSNDEIPASGEDVRSPALAPAVAGTMWPVLAPTSSVALEAAPEEAAAAGMHLASAAGPGQSRGRYRPALGGQTTDDRRWTTDSAALMAVPASTQVRFNEVRIGGEIPGTCSGSGMVYFELVGTPGTALGQLAILQIGNGGIFGESGVVEVVFKLENVVMPASGLLVVVGKNFCVPGVAFDVMAPVIFVNRPDNHTFLLVRGTTATAGMDLDLNNNCVLNQQPWIGVMDSVAFRYAAFRTCVYPAGPTNPSNFNAVFEPNPVTGIPPLHVFRCRPSGAWIAGSDVYGADVGGTLLPFDSPGAPNPPCFCVDQPDKGSCFTANVVAGCENSACETLVCADLPACCRTLWDHACALAAHEICPCGNPVAPSCFQPHGTPGCLDCECCTRVCLGDPFCCVVQWDLFCVFEAFDVCDTCGGAGTENCCTIHQSLSCSDESCCEAVCEVFLTCCLISWDFDCALLATEICPVCSFCGDPANGACIDVHPTPGCSEAGCCVRVCTVDPYCCGVTWDAICVQNALAICYKIDVCDNIGDGLTCFEEHKEIPGCSDRNCCAAVCTLDVTCCDVGWDTQCVDLAFLICSPFVCGSFSEGSCMQPTGLPGCNFGSCCLAVCAVDPNCCLVGWDSDCVVQALDTCCGAPGSGDCFSPSGSPFCEDKACCAAVCGKDPFCCAETWDSICAETAVELCPTPCVAFSEGLPILTGVRSCWIPHSPAGCETPAVCNDVCTIDPYCCQRLWDALCVQEAMALPGGPFPQCSTATGGCYVSHGGQGCTNVLCCRAVCSIDESCCTSAWDVSCAELALVVCASGLFPFPPPCPASGDCLMARNAPGCGDQVCCTVVCDIDQVCCLTSWDSACVRLAGDYCDEFLPPLCIPSIDSCFSVHDTPYCRSVECSDAVCATDMFCCEESWDIVCVTSATLLCNQGSGSLLAGACLEPSGTPGCSDWACSLRVCFDDPFCCIFSWDALCVDTAADVCLQGPCFATHLTPGCSSVDIMLVVCSQKQECCLVEWDAECADEAQAKFLPFTQKGGPGGCVGTGCAAKCGEAAAGNCFTAKITPNCDDLICCTDVCFSDAICCQELWDEICVEQARTICPILWEKSIFPPGDPCAGPCFLVKPLPNCNDATCSALVCADDPVCCETEWDNLCVERAVWACLECGDEGTGDCCSPHPTPYCNDENCCEDVCLFDPFCCSLGGAWDQFCVQLAQAQCPLLCPVFGCGDPSTGGCFSAHPTPYCSDEECCNFICGLVEPFCCQVAWDDLCVQAAFFFCP